MRSTRSRIAVLASGGGSNLQSLLDHFDRLGERRGGDIVVVASDRRAAGALDRATRRNIPVALIATPQRATGDAVADVLERHEVDLIVLAGYLRLVPLDVIHAFRGRVLNVHPALLPAFGGAGMYGQRVHHAVIESGARVSGLTVHFVDEEYDRGRIIAQWPVPVFAGDDAQTLAGRVLRVEHLVYPRVVDAVAAGRTTLENCGRANDLSVRDVLPAFTLLSHEDSRLAENIDLALGC
ncbi:MAG TPA: phosphoribosylglycinamide formyltransferase [Gemmatimonadaceae bacterium]|jgi:formyltetrahydrofolate-dependent phosphoribosylglycinamide formyltransferase